MWRCTGSLLTFALLLGACRGEPDVLITVRRELPQKVLATLCPIDADAGPCGLEPVLFSADEPVTVTKTIGIYLDHPADTLLVRFQRLSPGGCSALTLPLDGERPSVVLPDDSTAGVVTSCDGCTLEVCSP